MVIKPVIHRDLGWHSCSHVPHRQALDHGPPSSPPRPASKHTTRVQRREGTAKAMPKPARSAHAAIRSCHAGLRTPRDAGSVLTEDLDEVVGSLIARSADHQPIACHWSGIRRWRRRKFKLRLVVRVVTCPSCRRYARGAGQHARCAGHTPRSCGRPRCALT
jgi:hypothetical protein